jgi:hypothetical protein
MHVTVRAHKEPVGAGHECQRPSTNDDKWKPGHHAEAERCRHSIIKGMNVPQDAIFKKRKKGHRVFMSI